MKDNDYKRIEDQLDPDDRLVQNVMDKAAQFSANSALEEEYLKEHDVPDAVKVRRSNGYRYMLSTAAAVALVLGVNVYIHSNSPVKPREPDTSRTEETAEDVTESTPEIEVTENAPSAEIPAEVTESTADTPESNADDSAVENIGIGRLEWKPDKTADSFETENSDGQAAVLAPAADLYRSFELNGKTIDAMVYIMNPKGIAPPSPYYYDVIRKGYEMNGLDIAVLEQARMDSITKR